jgi:predicted HicB family RNase H-like nuclease
MQVGSYTADIEVEPEARRFRGRVVLGTDAFDFVGASYDELEREGLVSAAEYERAVRERQEHRDRGPGFTHHDRDDCREQGREPSRG